MVDVIPVDERTNAIKRYEDRLFIVVEDNDEIREANMATVRSVWDILSGALKNAGLQEVPQITIAEAKTASSFAAHVTRFYQQLEKEGRVRYGVLGGSLDVFMDLNETEKNVSVVDVLTQGMQRADMYSLDDCLGKMRSFISLYTAKPDEVLKRKIDGESFLDFFNNKYEYALCILASKVKTEDPQVLYQYILSALVFPGEIMAPSAEIDIKRRAQKEKYIFENLPDVIESPGALLI